MHRSFNDIFSNDLTDEGLASGFEYTVHQKFMTIRSAPGVVEMSNGHEITHSAREHDMANAARLK